MGKDEADGSCQILAGGLCAGAVNESEGVVALLGKLQRMREAVVHRAYIGESAARIAYGNRSPPALRGKRTAGILFIRISRFSPSV